ncbi:MAG: sigma 54-interacting transcriptional regulator [Magnetococcales bacterium]|nr:sigma 54-interacting transcriptional regulator [Magnetococcales bacterium]
MNTLNPMNALRPFLDGLEEGVLFLDRKRRVVAINQAASKMIGQAHERVVGQLCPSLFTGTDCAKACAARNDCALIPTREHNTRTLDLTLDRDNGSVIFLRMWAVLLPDVADMTLYAVILRDCTREMMLEEEARERMRLGGMVGHGPAMRELFQNILRAAMSHATVLIQGESGTGKELVARALHDNSPRSEGPYIRVHCASFPENLLESELFGYAKGAFTGAESPRIGRFEAADGGTILLDEIGEISTVTQVKLLRVLQEREVERLGENKVRKVDVRVIAATNRDLGAMVREGTFREDLYYRLKVLPITTPPLRERPEDISLLVQALLGEMMERYQREEVRLTTEAITLLECHSWPGNVRELSNALEYALVQTPGNTIHPHQFPPELLAQAPPLQPFDSPLQALAPPAYAPQASSFQPQATHPLASSPERKTVGYYRGGDAASEKKRILQVLAQTRGNKVEAAKQLGMSRTTLWKRIKAYGLDKG